MNLFRGSRGVGSPKDYYRKVGVLGAISLFFGDFWRDLPVILEVDPPSPKRLVISRLDPKSIKGPSKAFKGLTRVLGALQGP